MKKFNKISITSVSLVFSFLLPIIAFSATTPSLGTTGTFGVLSSTFTNTAGTTINGDVGYTTPPVVTPAINGTVHVANTVSNQAGADQSNLLSALNTPSCDFNFNSPTDLSLLPQPLVPGVYCVTAAASIGTAGITLNGSGTYIFRINGALTTVANSNVALTGGASACNVFWAPTSATTLGANSSFLGTDVDVAGITAGSTVTWSGRALAFGGTVTTNSDTISVPSCVSSTSTSTSTPTPTPTPTSAPAIAHPLIRVTKVPTLLSLLPLGGGSVSFDYAVSNIGTVAMNNITVNDNKCSPVNFLSGDTNNNAILEVSETWNYRCISNVSQTTTNTVTATGQANGFTATDSTDATVVVNTPDPTIILPPILTPTVDPTITTSTITPPPVVPPTIVTPPSIPVVTSVFVPTLPKTGFPPQEKSAPWNIILPAVIFGGLISFYLAQKKQTN